MRTEEEVRAELKKNGPDMPRMTDRDAIIYREGWLDALAWWLNDKGGK